MKWYNWEPHYQKIKENLREKNLSINFSKDKKSALILQKIIKEQKNKSKLDELINKILSKEIIIYGAGPSLKDEIKKLNTETYNDKTIIAVDGASKIFTEKEINPSPDIIVTDLDGDIESIKKLNEEGANLVIHAHGDNIPKIKKYVPKFTDIIGTTQTRPLEKVYNFGGFTDGDRAAFLAEELGAKKIILGGMDFGDTVGKYSDPSIEKSKEASELKKEKLKIAEELLELIEKTGNLENIKFLEN